MNEIEYLLSVHQGVLVRRAHRRLANRLDDELRRGRLVAIHPGVYCARGTEHRLEIRLLAAALWAGPDAVLTRHAAAWLTFRPKQRVPFITVATPTINKATTTAVRFERRVIPPELIWRRGPIAMTCPSLTAVDLADDWSGGAIIDDALRTGYGSLAGMWHAFELTPNRSGNAMRRRLLTQSRHLPWSEIEREAHRLLDAAGISGWVTNAPLLGFFVDVLFEKQMLVVELDGWEIHGTRAAFEDDRRRRNELELAGYRVLNFTWRQLVDDPEWFIDCVLRGLVYDGSSVVIAS